MGQEEIPIFYKGTTLSNYQEACHVLSCNNCVLLDDLFLRKGSIDAAVSNKFNEGITDIDDEEQDEESILDYFDNANAIDDFISPLKHHNDLSRFQNNIMTYVSPMTKRLHNEIQENSPSRLLHHNAVSLRESRKNMISIIDYIIDNGNVDEDPQTAILFDKMEKTLQMIKLEFQQLKISQPKTPPRKGMIEFPAFNAPKKKPEPRLKGLGG
jgi:hypothetical protein